MVQDGNKPVADMVTERIKRKKDGIEGKEKDYCVANGSDYNFLYESTENFGLLTLPPENSN